jgi:hypothetical protein
MMPAKYINTERSKESGNVRLLVLIAVALFAALAYAVMQSSLSESDEAMNAENLISTTEVTQFPAGVRKGIVRMMAERHIPVAQLEFNPPPEFSSLTADKSGKYTGGVFHADGGGVVYQQPAGNVMANGSAGTWYFNADFSIPNIGNEMIAFLPGLKKQACQKINNQRGIVSNPVPVVPGPAKNYEKTQGPAFPGDNTLELFSAAQGKPLVSAAAANRTPVSVLSGQPFGCFATDDTPPVYVYYHSLVER